MDFNEHLQIATCHNCQLEIPFECSAKLTQPIHFVKLAEALGWRLLVDDEAKEFKLFCTEDCANKHIGETYGP